VLGSGDFVLQRQENGVLGNPLGAHISLQELQKIVADKYAIQPGQLLKRFRLSYPAQARKLFC